MMPLKICLYVAIWKRPEVTVACLHNIKRLVEYRPELFEIIPHFVLSEDWAERLCEEFGFAFTRSQNNPLGRKMNKGIREALKYDFDWLVQLGSDDFIEPKVLDYYWPHFQHERFFGMRHLLVMDGRTGDMMSVGTHNVFGAMRCIHRSLLDKTMKSQGWLWEAKLNRALDGSSMKSIEKQTGEIPKPVNVPVFLFDYKTSENINAFGDMAGELVRVPLEMVPVEVKALLKMKLKDG
jgi:hypothetical protein